MASPFEQDKAAVKLAIAGFRSKLLREFPAWTSGDLSGFRNFVIGTLKATLPRQRAGRKANPTVIRAHDLYLKSQNANRPVSWHAIVQVVVPGYREAPPAILVFKFSK